MPIKYEKPVARNLGEMLPNAEGYCIVVGNSAKLPPPNLDCVSGALAMGAVCGYGGIPSNQACQEGHVPVYFGCLPGLQAHPGPCTAGNGVY